MIDKVKKRLKSKTYQAALVGMVLTAIDAQSGFFSGMFSEALRPYIVMVWPIAMMTLREVTDSALSDK